LLHHTKTAQGSEQEKSVSQQGGLIQEAKSTVASIGQIKPSSHLWSNITLDFAFLFGKSDDCHNHISFEKENERDKKTKIFPVSVQTLLVATRWAGLAGFFESCHLPAPAKPPSA